MSQEAHRDDEFFDLLAERATTGLDAEQERRLGQLLAAAEAELEAAAGIQADHFDLTAAALELAMPPQKEELPAGVELRLRREARRFAAGLPRSNVRAFRPREAAAGTEPALPKTDTSAPSPTPLVPANRSLPAEPTRSVLPWLIAAAFALAAITGWWRVYLLTSAGLSPSGPFAAGILPDGQPGTDIRKASNTDPAKARETLAAKAQPLPWTLTQDPAAQGVTGDVVWSAEDQRGYLRFQNLPANDSKVFQYQLWIFDATRDERFPIDGGVFDVPAGGEVVIPIDAKLPVREAAVFAVTIEKPGGVVVSSRERIVVLAKSI